MSEKTDHRPPRPVEGEKATLLEFLNYLRRRCDGSWFT
jgi:hypothetical protein